MTKPVDFHDLERHYKVARSRLILFDYDGTLVPFVNSPTIVHPGDTLKSLINRLAVDPKNQLMLISGRGKEDLDLMWEDTPVVMAAEHGGFCKNPGDSWREMFAISCEWTHEIIRAFKALTFYYEGSFVEQKHFSVAWHYRAISHRISESDKRQILAAIRSLPDHEHFAIYDGEYTIELRTPGIDKGSFIARWVDDRRYDFILAIGDGQTDEDLFKVLSQNAFTIKVGRSHRSAAQYHLETQTDVIPFIQKLVRVITGVQQGAEPTSHHLTNQKSCGS